MLELRRRGGNITGMGYAWLERAEFDPSQGIILYFLGKMVRITGNNLNAEIRPHVRLFNGILRHRRGFKRPARRPPCERPTLRSSWSGLSAGGQMPPGGRNEKQPF
jgi:hypothetical protein